MSYLTLLLLFLDYHRKDNIWKAFLQIGLIISGFFLVAILIHLLGFGVLKILPLFTVFPFILCLLSRKKNSSL